MQFWCKDSACRVFRHTRPEINDSASLQMHTGRNMLVWGQVLLRDSMHAFTVNGVTLDPLPCGLEADIYMQGYEIFNDGLPYPDSLLPLSPTDVSTNATQGIVLVFRTKPDMPCGVYTFSCTVDTTLGTFTASVYLTVHKACLGEPADAVFDHEYFYSLLPEGFDCQPFDGNWCSLMECTAEEMRRLRVNVLPLNIVYFLHIGQSKRVSKTEWTLDFSKLDAFIEMMLKHGSFKTLVCSGSIAGLSGKTISALDENGDTTDIPIFENGTDTPTEEAEAWAKAYYGGIYTHFRDRGLLPMLRMHLQDEPHGTACWLWARGKCEDCMPGVPCGEPIDTTGTSRILAGKCDLFIPRFDAYDSEALFFRERQAVGDTVWCYSCCYPEEPWWLNRFIDLPHMYTRLIYWACFSQKITGFLHWGFNAFGRASLYGIGPGARFKGDGYVVYPDTEHYAVRPSVRGLATAQGVEECELLMKLAKTDAALADTIGISAARTFRDFEKNPAILEAARVRLLNALDAE